MKKIGIKFWFLLPQIIVALLIGIPVWTAEASTAKILVPLGLMLWFYQVILLCIGSYLNHFQLVSHFSDKWQMAILS
jgi:glucose dehydrogenase